MYNSSISPIGAAAISGVLCIFLASSLFLVLYLNRQKSFSSERSDVGLQCNLMICVEDSQDAFAVKSCDFGAADSDVDSVDSDYHSDNGQNMNMSQTDDYYYWDNQSYTYDDPCGCEDDSSKTLYRSSKLRYLEKRVKEMVTVIAKIDDALNQSNELGLKDQSFVSSRSFLQDDEGESVDTLISDADISSFSFSSDKEQIAEIK